MHSSIVPLLHAGSHVVILSFVNHILKRHWGGLWPQNPPETRESRRGNLSDRTSKQSGWGKNAALRQEDCLHKMLSKSTHHRGLCLILVIPYQSAVCHLSYLLGSTWDPEANDDLSAPTDGEARTQNHTLCRKGCDPDCNYFFMKRGFPEVPASPHEKVLKWRWWEEGGGHAEKKGGEEEKLFMLITRLGASMKRCPVVGGGKMKL